MKLNMGKSDRIIRIIIAIIIAILYFKGQISGVAAIILGIIAVIFVLTGIIGFCQLYVPFKFSTKKGIKQYGYWSRECSMGFFCRPVRSVCNSQQ